MQWSVAVALIHGAGFAALAQENGPGGREEQEERIFTDEVTGELILWDGSPVPLYPLTELEAGDPKELVSRLLRIVRREWPGGGRGDESSNPLDPLRLFPGAQATGPTGPDEPSEKEEDLRPGAPSSAEGEGAGPQGVYEDAQGRRYGADGRRLDLPDSSGEAGPRSGVAQLSEELRAEMDPVRRTGLLYKLAEAHLSAGEAGEAMDVFLSELANAADSDVRRVLLQGLLLYATRAGEAEAAHDAYRELLQWSGTGHVERGPRDAYFSLLLREAGSENQIAELESLLTAALPATEREEVLEDLSALLALSPGREPRALEVGFEAMSSAPPQPAQVRRFLEIAERGRLFDTAERGCERLAGEQPHRRKFWDELGLKLAIVSGDVAAVGRWERRLIEDSLSGAWIQLREAEILRERGQDEAAARAVAQAAREVSDPERRVALRLYAARLLDLSGAFREAVDTYREAPEGDSPAYLKAAAAEMVFCMCAREGRSDELFEYLRPRRAEDAPSPREPPGEENP